MCRHDELFLAVDDEAHQLGARRDAELREHVAQVVGERLGEVPVQRRRLEQAARVRGPGECPRLGRTSRGDLELGEPRAGDRSRASAPGPG